MCKGKAVVICGVHNGISKAGVYVSVGNLLFGQELITYGSEAESELKVGFVHTALHVENGHLVNLVSVIVVNGKG